MARVGRKNKTKFVLCKELVILVVVLVAMLVATICLSIPSKAEKQLEEFNVAINTYNSTNSTSYGLLGDDHVFKKAELKDVEKAINDSSKGSAEEPAYAYVLYGSLENSKVLEFLSIINTEAKNREKDCVYFYNSSKVDNQEDKEDESFLAEIANDEKVFKESETCEVDLLKTPAFYVYKNGEIVLSSLTYDDNTLYNWHQMIRIAFSL